MKVSEGRNVVVISVDGTGSLHHFANIPVGVHWTLVHDRILTKIQRRLENIFLVCVSLNDILWLLLKLQNLTSIF